MMDNRFRSHREHVYRNWAAWLVKRYGLIRFKDIDLAGIHRRGNNGADWALRSAAKHRKYASCGLLLAAIRSAARFAGAAVEMIEAAGTTRTCCECGGKFEAGAKLMGRCADCSREMDQDWNAAVNIYRAKRPGRGEGSAFAENPREPQPVGA